MQKIIPFFWFNEQAEEAVNFYTSIFTRSQIGDIARFGDDVPGPAGKVLTITFQLAGQEFMALNGGPMFSFTPATSFFVSCQTEEEILTLWKNFTHGGAILMELDQYPFSEQFGWVMDRYGVSWQLSLERVPQKIANYFLFVGQQHGRAEQAMRYYTSLFQNSGVDLIQRYGKDQDEPEGTIMHARFHLEGSEFMAMDSARGHDFTFSPAISFYVNCQDQAEVDHFWDRLSEGGETEQCGWLKDKFGISWQIVPTVLGELMADPDPDRASRVTQAMLKMVKLDIAGLKQAYERG